MKLPSIPSEPLVGDQTPNLSWRLFFDSVVKRAKAESDFEQDHLSVKMFGAKGDGTTNDTVAIQAAIDACAGKTIEFPPGVYRTTAPLVVKKQNTRLLGHTATIYFSGTGAILKLTDDAGANVFGVSVEGLLLKGTATATDGLWIHGSHHIHIKDVEVHDVAGAGARTGFCVCGLWENFRVSLNTAVWVQRPAFGMFIGDGSMGVSAFTTAQTITDPIIEGVSDTGILFSQSLFNQVSGGTCEQSGGWGLTVGPNAKNSTITATDFEANTSGDLYIWGLETTVINCQSDSLLRVDPHAIGTKVRGGLYYSITLESGSTATTLDSCSYANDLGSGPGVLTDNGTDTQLIGPIKRPLNRISHVVQCGQMIEQRAAHNIISGVVNADDAPFCLGTWTFTNSASTTISDRAVFSSGGPWRALFIGSWVNDWEGAGLVQPAFIAELTTAHPTMTIGSRTVTFSVTGNRFVGICNQASSKVGFIGYVLISTQSLGTAGIVSMILQNALTIGGDLTAQALNCTSGTITGKLTVNASVAGDTAMNFINSSATGYGLRVLGGGSDAAHYLAAFNDSGGTNKVLIDGNGDVTVVPLAGASSSAVGVDTAGKFQRISGAAPTGAAGGDLAGTYPNPTLKATGTAGTYTRVTTDAQGRVTSGTSTTLSGTISLAKLTAGGTNGSITVSNGEIIGFVNPT